MSKSEQNTYEQMASAKLQRDSLRQGKELILQDIQAQITCVDELVLMEKSEAADCPTKQAEVAFRLRQHREKIKLLLGDLESQEARITQYEGRIETFINLLEIGDIIDKPEHEAGTTDDS